MKRVTIKKILNKKGKKPIICLTAYSKVTAEILDKYCDIILVGDSLGMVLYGMKSTREVGFETMLAHGKTVKKYSKKSLVVIDMPYKTYLNKSSAYKNAKKLIKSTKCDAVKLEGGKEICNIIKYLTNKGVPVVGHIGLLPQYSSRFKSKGKKSYERKKILNDAISISKSGVFAIVMECVVESLAKKITETISVPTIGIGSSKFCDGQILVTDDIMGLTNLEAKFVKKYTDIKKIMESNVKKYCNDIIRRKFPSPLHTYKF